MERSDPTNQPDSTDETRRPIAVVTGSSAGVGRAVAVELARRGHDVALLARGRAGLEGAAAEVRLAGGRAAVVPTDVGDPDAVERAADQVESELGPIDLWVNNAMATVFAPVADTEPAEFEMATRTTYLGTVWGTMAALRRMRPRDRGRVVQVGSALAYRAIPFQAAYCGAKFAIRGFTDSTRAELLAAGSNVGLTMVQLPAVDTPQFLWQRAKLPGMPTPVPPVCSPELAARVIAWAASADRREVWLGGRASLLMLLGALTPGGLDHYLGATGFDSQQTDQLLDGPRDGNLDRPWDEGCDWGTHGEPVEPVRDTWWEERLATLVPSTGPLSRAVGQVLRRVL